MKTHFEIGSVRKMAGNVLAGIFVLCLFSLSIPAQSPPNPPPPPQNIAAGALVIPMDNYHQGNGDQSTFNLRAYGLANLFLQNNIPVKWAIKPGKAKDAVDFTANVTRISGGPVGDPGPLNASFSGGPFVIPVEYDTASLRTLLTNFNNAGTPVVVYKTNAAASIDVRYNLTHKPKIAIGPDGGGFGAGVHQAIFNAAGITQYQAVDDSIINTNSCYTLATQAHSESSNFVSLYKQFAQSGGNLLLQCASIETFENNPAGHFQTNNAGYNIFGTTPSTGAVSTTLAYPEGAMPFNQFIGILANQTGRVTEYSYASGNTGINGNRVSVRNSGSDANKFVATVSELGAPGTPGSAVFELGGHNYARPDDGETDSAISMLNGQRMLLNAVFVPVTRPAACGLQQATVLGYKSVRRFNVREGGLPLVPGDTLEWTIDYVNNSPVAVSNFNIRDEIGVIDGEFRGNLTLVPGSNTVTVLSGGAAATRNVLYDGLGNDSTSDLLSAGATLPVGGRIQVKIRTLINLLGSDGQPLPNDQILYNQGIGRGDQLVGTVKSDAIDATNTTIFGIDTPPAGSFLQFQNVGILDPTIARIKRPTAADASISGRVRTDSGNAISGATVTVTNAANGETKVGRSDSFGNFTVAGLEVGNLYIVSVEHKRYRFADGVVSFSLNDNVTGLAFVGSTGGTKVTTPTAVKSSVR